MPALAEAEQEVLERLQTDFPYYAEHCLKIVNKAGQLVPFLLNDAQQELHALLEEQRIEGKRQMALALKARRVGISTYAQGRLIHRTTLRENHSAMVVAHDLETGGILFDIGQTMYVNLPDEEMLKPPIKRHRTERFLHFANPDLDSWKTGNVGLNSRYRVNTANEFGGGRGGGFPSFAGSEVAHWAKIAEKLSAVLPTVPNIPEALVLLETTANGMNEYKDYWDDAEDGKTDWIPFFWPWWKQLDYALPFFDDRHREEFERDVGQGAIGEDEPWLLKQEWTTRDGRTHQVTMEQLHWRRRTIATEYAGDLTLFRQEYPATATEAFIGSGNRVFDTEKVKVAISEAIPPQVTGKLEAKKKVESAGRAGTISIPEDPFLISRAEMEVGVTAPWEFWLDTDDKGQLIVPDSQFVIGVDVSGGEVEAENAEPAFHAIEIIDHFTGVQVAEYSSRIDPHLLTAEIYMAAKLFNNAWVAVEKTGNWGQPLVHTLWFDYHYPYTYRRRKHGTTQEKTEKLLGWDTTPRTKPILLSRGQELLGTDSHGVKSRALAGEMLTYIRDDKAKTMPEPGKFSDRLIAWLIAQQVRSEIPPRLAEDEGVVQMWAPTNARTGY